MTKHRLSALNTTIVLMILAMGLAIIIVQYAVSYKLEIEHVKQHAYKHIPAVGNRLRALSGHLAHPDSLSVLNEEIAMVKKMGKLQHIVFSGADNAVLASTTPDWIGMSVIKTPLSYTLSQSNGLIVSERSKIHEDSHSNLITGTFTYSANRENASNPAAMSGRIIVTQDLSIAISETHNRVLKIAVVSGALVIFLSGLFWFAINHVVSKPLSQLVSTARRFSKGEFNDPCDITQRNELGEISNALNELRTATQARQRIQASNSLLAQIVEDSANEVYVANASSYQIINANSIARARLGYTREETHSLYLWDIFADVSPDVIKQMISPLIDKEKVFSALKTDHKRKDGTTYPAKTSLQYIDKQHPPFVAAIAEDISEKQLQNEAITLRNRAIDSLDVGVSITDALADGYPIVYVNQQLCNLTGYQPEELIGKPSRFLHSGHNSQTALKQINQAKACGQAVQVVFESKRRDGKRYIDELSLSPIHNDNNELTHYIGINRDITESLENQKRLHQAQKIEAIGQLSSGIAHDFNNLLSVIGSNLDLLKIVVTDDEGIEYITDAENAVRMGSRLTRRLLTFARQNDASVSIVQVNEVVNNALDILRSTMGNRITITTKLEPKLWFVRVDPSEIENTVVNLALNARDAIQGHGKICITTSNLKIERHNKRELSPGEYVRLSVADNGCGMTDEVKARVFEPFYTTKDTGKGTGLGLSSTFGFAKQSGGHTEIESKPGEGTEIYVYLPRHIESTEFSMHPVHESTVNEERHGRILVVDDNDMVRKTALKRLSILGYETESAASAEQAIDHLKKDSRFDLVFSDVVMAGGMSGYDLARWIQSHTPHCRTLLTSGFNAHITDTNMHEPRCGQVLQKPYSTTQLQSALREALEPFKA